MNYSYHSVNHSWLLAALSAAMLSGCTGEDGGKAPDTTKPAAQAVNSAPTQAPVPNAAQTQVPSVQVPPPKPVVPTIILSNDNSGLVNIAKGKLSKQSSTIGAAVSSRAVDGNVNGSWAANSVSSTAANDKNPWLEIDLGEVESIDHIIVWNRTDCCSERLSNYWIFISDKPFEATDTAEMLTKNKNIKAIIGAEAKPSYITKSGIGKGRFVRIQLGGMQQATEPRYLSVAEVEVFRAK